MKAEEYLDFWIKEAMAFMYEKKVFNEFCERLEEIRLSEGTAIE